MAEGRNRIGGDRRRGFRAGRALNDDDDDGFDDEAEGQYLRRGGRGYRDRQAVFDYDDDDDRRPRRNQDRGHRNDRGAARDERGGDRRNAGRDDRGGDRRNDGRGGGGGRGRNRGQGGNEGGRPGRKLILTERFMRDDLIKRDAADIVLSLSSPQTAFRDALTECVNKPSMLKIMLSVLAKAFQCKSAPAQFNRAYIIIEESHFFDNVASYFLDMRAEESYVRQLEFKQPIHDLICVMEGLVEKNPTSITQFVGIHDILRMVIDHLRERSTVIDDDLLKSFRAFTERKEILLNRRMRKREEPQNNTPYDDAPFDDEPPDDFREIQIFPQTADMQVENDRYLRANKVKGRYQDVDHYLDVQFRLLREDFVAPLREGVSTYIQAIEENPRKKHKSHDVRMYYNVRLIAPDPRDNGLCHILQFDVSGLGKVIWKSTKRLIYGSLLCLSSDNFRTFYFATVKNRDAKEASKGLVSVHFEHEQAVVRHLVGQVFTMAETTAYFESYCHVLKGLQNIRDGDLPFERYIIQCESQVNAPEYIRRRPDVKYDLRPLVDEDMIIIDNKRLGEHIGELEERVMEHTFSEHSLPAKEVPVLDQRNWPPSDLLHLDESQYKAIRTALTKEFAITQGPPGTGKTYIGLKIVKALLHNKSVWSKHPDTGDDDLRPMLIVCYTNHALDQFLEGIDKFYKGDIVRVGSRSNSEILKPYGLHNFRQRFRHAHKIPVAVYRARREAKNEMESVMTEIMQVSANIQQANTCILHETGLRSQMGKHYNLLIEQFYDVMENYGTGEYFDKDLSVIVEWLGLGNLQPIVEMEGELAVDDQMEMNDDQDENLIDVDYEANAIQEQRKLDDDFEEEDDDNGWPDEPDLTRREKMEKKIQQAVRNQRKHVALDVENVAEKPQNIQANEWEVQKGQKKKMKKSLQRNLASGNIMSEEEAQRVNNLWRMKMQQKWRLYRLWVLKYCDDLRTMINEKEDEYDDAAKRYQEALMQEDKEILKHSTIIGMTTTGAAKYQRVLQELKPRIIVVEEAAEVLEAHVVTTLSRGCEHLILIGDHKQLKPNPTVYTLATNYNLDVSLFERMVDNGIRCDCLELQHRMRPEISELMKHIYENLRDHDDVKKYDAIKGISCNMFFIDHKNEETHHEDLRSHSNLHEAEYIKHLCKYLLLQGYRPEQITVLTLYSGQLFCLRGIMPKDEFNGIRVTVVDNYQGEENDIILLSLVRSNNEGNIGFLKIENRVCVALSRAKKGFYVIGNFSLLKSQSKLWNEIVIDLKNKDRLGEGLELFCQNHPENDRIIAKEPTDFLLAPEGGCNQKCNYRLNCGHVCEMFCHVTDQQHDNYVCMKMCGKIICRNGHRCQSACGAKCGPCLQKVPIKLPKCGHIQQIPCSTDIDEFECKAKCQDKLKCGHECQALCGMAHTQNCNEKVRKRWSCGHEGIIACHQKDIALCPAPCGLRLDCEHRCSGTCGECFQGRLHKPCKNNCIRILVCGHECTDTCNQCPPCTKKCENRCAHSKCNRRCGELCTPCMEPCEWQCEHYKCNKLCSEPCDREKCDQPCRKTLQCGHDCIGLCGEPCPPDCRVCDTEKVTEIMFGEEDEPYARFVLMEDCRAKCIIESGAMDKYMDGNVDSEIKLRECPLCKTTIRKSNRYKEKINRTLQDIEGVKKSVLQNMAKVRELESKIQDALNEDLPAGIKLKLKRRFQNLPEPKSENALVAISNQITFSREVAKLEDEWNARVRLPLFKEDKEQQLRFIQHLKDWLMTERTNMSAQETRDAELEISRAKAYLLLLLYQQKAKEIGKNFDQGLKVKIAEAERLIKGPGKYQEALRVKVESCLTDLQDCCPLTNIGISDAERMEIVQAIALPKGHWFKCPNGHIYAIGECGGANETSKCPECGCIIGGENHNLQSGNQLASEMDDAQHPAWSEQANLLNYGFNAQF